MLADTRKTVGELCLLVQEGEERTFKRRTELTGREPVFFRVSTAGEYAELPRWDNAPPIERRPRPSVHDWSEAPVSALEEFHFSINANADELADLYRIAPGVFLVSELALNVLNGHDPGSLEIGTARLRIADGVVSNDFKIVMPRCVLDVVDVDKTDVVIARAETVPNSGKYVTQVNYPHGFVVREDIVQGAISFLGKYDANWWWRDDLVRSAVSAGMRGLRAVSTSKSSMQPEIRT
jgi:hypothetical protein